MQRESQKVWNKANPGKWKEYSRRYHAKNADPRSDYSLRHRWGQMRLRSRRRGDAFFLIVEDFVQWYLETEDKCAYCGIPAKYLENVYGLRKKLRTGSLSVDRKDNKQPYSLGNIVKACWQCNTTKSDTFSFEEMKEIGTLIRELIVKRFS